MRDRISDTVRNLADQVVHLTSTLEERNTEIDMLTSRVDALNAEYQ